MEKFVCVRIVQGNGMDLSLFQFDYDMSFAVFFLNPDRTVYGRYGTRSKRPKEADVDITLEGLAEAMKASLALHQKFPANRSALAAKTGPKPLFPVPEKFPEIANAGRYSSELASGDKKTISQSCIHCHQIRDAERSYYFGKHEPLPLDVLYPWPMPELLGLDLDRTKRATVQAVTSGSPAADAGIKAGDELLTLAGQPLVSLADVQWVLHRAADHDKLAATVRRDGRIEELALTLPAGWREQGDISWRSSSWDLRRITTGGLLLEALSDEERRARQIADDSMALLVMHVGQYNEHAAAKHAGFQKDDLIVSYDRVTKPWRETDFFAYVLNNKKAGDQVPVTVLRGGKRLDLKLPVQD